MRVVSLSLVRCQTGKRLSNYHGATGRAASTFMRALMSARASAATSADVKRAWHLLPRLHKTLIPISGRSQDAYHLNGGFEFDDVGLPNREEMESMISPPWLESREITVNCVSSPLLPTSALNSAYEAQAGRLSAPGMCSPPLRPPLEPAVEYTQQVSWAMYLLGDKSLHAFSAGLIFPPSGRPRTLTGSAE